MIKRGLVNFAAAVVVAVAAGCSSANRGSARGSGTEEPAGTATHDQAAHQHAGVDSVVVAVCALSPTAGNQVTGTVTFTSGPGGITVRALVTGLTPGDHGFHIHEFGDCSAPDGSSAGAHFNPGAMPHGGPDAAQRHKGDLGNLFADSTGTARYERMDMMLAVAGETSIIGRSMIVHAHPDDYTTQPTGAAGARLACGVILAPGR
jgi:Cu-Zn family superoxide dismutase